MPWPKGKPRPPEHRPPHRKKGTSNKATRAWKDFVAELVSDATTQERLAQAIAERPELLFKAAEHAVGKPRQTVEVASSDKFCWTPPARADGPIEVPANMLILPRGAHIHGADVDDRDGEIHCHLCHENWAARVDEKLECPRCLLHPEERTDRGYP